MSSPSTEATGPRWVRAGEPLVLHIRQDLAEPDGWGHALCGEGSFAWRRVDDVGEFVGSPCGVCISVADLDPVAPVVLDRTNVPPRHVVDLRVASSGQGASALDPGGRDAEHGPAGVRHGYRPGHHRTLCGRPLLELYLWPGLGWPEQSPAGELCYSCALVAQTGI